MQINIGGATVTFSPTEEVVDLLREFAKELHIELDKKLEDAGVDVPMSGARMNRDE